MRSREGNGKRVLLTGRLSARAPVGVANEDCGEGVSRGCADADGSRISAVQQH